MLFTLAKVVNILWFKLNVKFCYVLKLIWHIQGFEVMVGEKTEPWTLKTYFSNYLRLYHNETTLTWKGILFNKSASHLQQFKPFQSF